MCQRTIDIFDAQLWKKKEITERQLLNKKNSHNFDQHTNYTVLHLGPKWDDWFFISSFHLARTIKWVNV